MTRLLKNSCLLLMCLGGAQSSYALSISSGNLDFGVDQYGAIGSNFTSNTVLNGSTNISSGTISNPALVFAGFLYFSDTQQYLGDDVTGFKGRTQAASTVATTSQTATTVNSQYQATVGASTLDVSVSTVADGSGGVSQTYTLLNNSAASISLNIAYMLDLDIGSNSSDDSSSVADNFIRAWDNDFTNPGNPLASSFLDPLFAVSTSLATAGLAAGGSTATLNALDTNSLSTTDILLTDIGAGFDYGLVTINSGSSAVFNLDFLSGGALPATVAMSSSIWLFGLTALGLLAANRSARRKGSTPTQYRTI